jgi:hypothetical protein
MSRIINNNEPRCLQIEWIYLTVFKYNANEYYFKQEISSIGLEKGK